MRKVIKKVVPKEFENSRNIGLVFLGIGLLLLTLNISSLLSFLPGKYEKVPFWISVLSSVIIILCSVRLIKKSCNK